MELTPDEQILDIEQMLDIIVNIINTNELPINLSGDLMSASLIEFHQKLSVRLESMLEQLNR